MTSKISWKTNLDEKHAFKENESAFAGINYKDEPTLKSKRLKQSGGNQNDFWNQRAWNWIPNGCS
jgi:hypothetical protein